MITIIQPPILATIHNIAVVIDSDQVLISNEREVQTYIQEVSVLRLF